MAPVILETDVHCVGCANKIRRAIQNYLGVERVWASPETGLVVVAGTADAAVLRRRIRDKMKRKVTVVSDSTVEQPLDGTVPWGAMAPQYAPAPYGGWGMPPPPHHPHPYAPHPPPGYPYAGNHYGLPGRYVSNGAPTCFHDEVYDDDEPCCSIQ